MLLTMLDAVLLFAFSIPVVMQYRILPIDGTPYWLFGILFLILLGNSLISYDPALLGRFRKYLSRIKLGLLTLTVAIALGGAVVTAMFDRAKTAPVYQVHDIILQQEAAMRFLLVGKNPYKETYFGTPVESFHYAEVNNDHAVNPALYHFVMPPWYLLFPFPFYYVSNHTLGFFDAREVSVFCLATLLVFLWYWYRNKDFARTAMVLAALSPAVVNYFVEGRSDTFALSWMIGSLVLLSGRRYIWSAILLGLAFLSKQTTWFIAPFIAVYLLKLHGPDRKIIWKYALVAGAVVLLGVLPFLLWDWRSFVDSVILYLTGNSLHSYPVSGYGLGMMLYEFGFIRDIHAYYPFSVWQILIAGPVLFFLVRWQWKKNTVSRLLLSYGVFLMVYWYLSRYFNNSHLGFLSSVFAIGGLKAADEDA